VVNAGIKSYAHEIIMRLLKYLTVINRLKAIWNTFSPSSVPAQGRPALGAHAFSGKHMSGGEGGRSDSFVTP